jgi:O-Antigen ligase
VPAVALLAYGAALAAGAVLVWRRPARALYAFIVGLAVHNAVMAGLYWAGVRGRPLTVIAAWKEVLLAVALASVALAAARNRRLPFRPGAVDALALLFAALVVLFALIPQDWLDGNADGVTILYGLRHAGTCVAAYFLGRSIERPPFRRLVLATAAAVAVLGLVEVYTVSVDDWEDAHVPEYFERQLGFEHDGPRGLPENFVFNTGAESELLRRLVSTFLSPLGTAYMLVVALCLWAASPRRWWPLAAIAAVGLLFTFTRAALLALAGALVVLAAIQRRWWPALAAAGVVAVGFVWTEVFPAVAPEASWTQAELEEQRRRARELGVPPGEVVSLDEPSIRSHLTALRDGVETVLEHPQGFGLGNSGATALRREVPLRAGESTYTELGVETGLLGALVFIAWNVALFWALARRGAAGIAAALAAVLALAVQTDVLGVPWLAYVVWMLAGATLTACQSRSTRASTSATSI